MNKTGKRILIGALSLALVGGLVAGGFHLARSRGNEPVNVYPLSEVGMSGYWGDESTAYGPVTTDKFQPVYVSTTQIVQEVHVEEGQEVKIGDPLLSYDTTLSALQVETKGLEIQRIEMDIKKAQDELKDLKSYKPGRPIPSGGYIPSFYSVLDQSIYEEDWMVLEETAGFQVAGIRPLGLGTLTFLNTVVNPEDSLESSTAEENTGESTPESTPAPETSSTPESSSVPESSSETEPVTLPEETLAEADKPVWISGDGSRKLPYIYLWPEDQSLSAPMIKYLLGEKDSAWVILMVRDQDKMIDDSKLGEATGEDLYTKHKYSFLYELKRVDEKVQMIPRGYLSEKEDPMKGYNGENPAETEAPTTEAPPTEAPSTIAPPVIAPTTKAPTTAGTAPSGPTFTSKELARFISDKELEIRDLEINKLVAEMEHKRLKEELESGTVVSKINGVVKTLIDADQAAIDQTPMIVVSGGGGYYIESSVSELDLENIEIGQIVTINNWETGEMLEGIIHEISDMPLAGESQYYYNGIGNSNVSYYPFTVFVDENANMREGSYVDITYSASKESDADSLYIETMFVRTENNEDYVMVVGADGLLEKRVIRTGKNLWGSYVQVIDGLTIDDRVAFPYGKNVVPGAAVQDSTIQELYESMY